MPIRTGRHFQKSALTQQKIKPGHKHLDKKTAMKIDVNKQYTCNGKPVELLHRVPEGAPTDYPIRGYVDGDEETWTEDGKYFLSDDDNAKGRLVEVVPKWRGKIWVHEKECVTSANMEGFEGWRLIEVEEVGS